MKFLLKKIFLDSFIIKIDAIELKKRYKVAYLDKIPSAKTKVKREKLKNVY